MGSYLLSGAAGLLVVLAAVSLIALVWEQIPDTWKVGGLGLLAIGMTTAGTTLAENKPRLQVAAATVTGTGGALGFVTIIGAVQMLGVQAITALPLMAAWGFVLLLVSWTTQQFFTAVISAVGALVTVLFACAQANAQPGQATLLWTLVNGYVIVLAAVCALLPHYTPRMRLVQWFPTTSIVVTATALLIGPLGLLSDRPPAGTMLLCLPAVVLLAQTHHSGRLLSLASAPQAAAWEWAGMGAALTLAVLRFGLMSAVVEAQPGLSTTLILAAVTASTAALLTYGGTGNSWPRSVVGVNLWVMLAVGGAAFAVDKRLLLPAVLALALASVPVVGGGGATPVPMLPGTGLAALAFAVTHRPQPVVVGLAIVTVIIAVGLGVLLESRLTPAPDGPPGTARSNTHAAQLTAAAWLIAADLVVVLPALVDALVPGTTTAALLAASCALAVSGLGLFTRGCTPMALVSGARAGALEGARSLRTPLSQHVPTLSRLGFGLLSLQAAVTLMAADATRATSGVLTATPLLLLGPALMVAGTRLLLPWLGRTAPTVAIAVSLSLALWWSAAILTGASPTSMFITALVLVTGAVCIVVGFRARAVALRHYGLTLVMAVVVKLAVLDLSDGNSLTQILALLVAGLVCFCLSLAYNRFANEQSRHATATGAATTGPEDHQAPPHA